MAVSLRPTVSFAKLNFKERLSGVLVPELLRPREEASWKPLHAQLNCGPSEPQAAQCAIAFIELFALAT
jgi:hypothetical protein